MDIMALLVLYNTDLTCSGDDPIISFEIKDPDLLKKPTAMLSNDTGTHKFRRFWNLKKSYFKQ